MALIKTAYDLSGGAARSSVITGGTYLDLQAFLTTVAGRVSYKFQKRNTSSGDWIDMKSEDNGIVFHTINVVEDGLSIQLNGSGVEYSIYIEPGANTTGTLNLDAVTDGTIA